jgi:hypothetical protein
MSAASWVASGALLLATVSGTWFMIAYSRRGPWWRPRPDDPHGEHRAHLGYFTASLTLTFWIYLFRPAFEPGVFVWVRAVLFSVIALMMAWRLVLLLRRPRHRLAGVPSS